MSAELGSVSPFAMYLGTFADGAPVWALILLSIAVHWFVLLMPPLFFISFLDRKLAADIQMRIGPNRVTKYGLLQTVADIIKAVFKEDIRPSAQEGALFRWGAVGAIVCVFTALGGIPMAESWALSNLDSGLVFVLVTLLLSNLCLFWAAYSVESEWSVLSSFRILSMVTAYIVPMAVAAIPPILIAGSPNFDGIVRAQGGLPWKWILFHDPGAAWSGAALFISLLVWQGRTPFDHHRAVGEIDGGYAGEYSGLRSGLLSFLQYAALFLASALVVTCYLGGWQTPFNLESFGRAADLVQWLFFTFKTFFLVFISIWIRWSLPRMRIDQIVKLSWRVLVPMGLLGSVFVAIWIVLFHGKGLGDFL